MWGPIPLHQRKQEHVLVVAGKFQEEHVRVVNKIHQAQERHKAECRTLEQAVREEGREEERAQFAEERKIWETERAQLLAAARRDKVDLRGFSHTLRLHMELSNLPLLVGHFKL
ncbi:hypothetical protein BU17DRAFT_90891 [Hysterangium stoloniferum]|nr:hypothetical protein BU17DRAFT_90891 [Hysterangium stoloniferum]